MQSPAIQGYPTQCPVCSSHYNHSEETEVIFENRGESVVHLSCQKCKSFLLVSLRMNPMGLAGIGMLTDLNREEALFFLNQKMLISNEEILSVYVELKNEKVKVKNLFS
jgi:hypothetical protein